jgi:8-oxo-dGTP pyrophosphatase MutT (NUDIX family)
MLESSQTMFPGRILQVNIERVRLPNGLTADLEIAHHPGGAAIVALDDRQRVCLLYQYRHAAQGWLWELPAGKIDNREPPIETARRELGEEAGMAANSWVSLGKSISSPGVFTEAVHLYLARDLTAIAAAPEEHEVFQVAWLPCKQAVLMAETGQIEDGKTVAGLLRARRYLGNAG